VIVFVDTSALIKLYIVEDGSERTRALIGGSTVAVSTLAFAEVHATFARRHREGLLDESEHRALARQFRLEWPSTLRVAVDERVLEAIPDLSLRYPLRGADAVHLASALLLRDEGLSIVFACSDRRLLHAARAAGLDSEDPAA